MNVSTEQVLQINGRALAFKRWGSTTGQPILAIHGWLDNAASFDHVAGQINADQQQMVVPDLPGHGLSEHRSHDSDYYQWTYARDLLALVNALGWGDYLIVAHSMGTGIATMMQALDKRVQALVFLDGMGIPFITPDAHSVAYFVRAYKLQHMADKSGLHAATEQGATYFASHEAALAARMKGIAGQLTVAVATQLLARDLMAEGTGYRWRHDPRLSLPAPWQPSVAQAQALVAYINCPVDCLLGKEGLFATTFALQAMHFPEHMRSFWFEGGHHCHMDEHNQALAAQLASIFNQYLHRYEPAS